MRTVDLYVSVSLTPSYLSVHLLEEEYLVRRVSRGKLREHDQSPQGNLPSDWSVTVTLYRKGQCLQAHLRQRFVVFRFRYNPPVVTLSQRLGDPMYGVVSV